MGRGRLITTWLSRTLVVSLVITSLTIGPSAGRGVAALVAEMSEGQATAFLKNPAGGSRFVGTVVHQLTHKILRVEFPGRFVYNRIGPDLLDTMTGELIELTTPGQLGRHMARPGYGGASFVTYIVGGR
jgi:hypothetical protein